MDAPFSYFNVISNNGFELQQTPTLEEAFPSSSITEAILLCRSGLETEINQILLLEILLLILRLTRIVMTQYDPAILYRKE